MDLQKAGGLTARKMESNEAAVALTRAANTAPAKILAKANTITLAQYRIVQLALAGSPS